MWQGSAYLDESKFCHLFLELFATSLISQAPCCKLRPYHPPTCAPSNCLSSHPLITCPLTHKSSCCFQLMNHSLLIVLEVHHCPLSQIKLTKRSLVILIEYCVTSAADGLLAPLSRRQLPGTVAWCGEQWPHGAWDWLCKSNVLAELSGAPLVVSSQRCHIGLCVLTVLWQCSDSGLLCALTVLWQWASVCSGHVLAVFSLWYLL